ncbi:periplasmic heavy metal sensor [bacterium]|nr:periplasmic heavy metal sensor [bacterium]
MKLVLHIFLALAIVAGSASAQKHRGPPDEKRERLETVIIGKFAEELELTPAQAEKFYPRLRQYRSETDDLQRQLTESRRRLDVLSSDKSADSKEVKELISSNKRLQTEILTKREAMLSDMSEFLTPQQVSRCSVLLDELPRRLRQLMNERGREREDEPPRRGRY